MVGDYYRYIAEVAQGEKLETANIKVQQAFEEVYANVDPCSSVSLGMNLGFSVYQYEVLKNE